MTNIGSYIELWSYRQLAKYIRVFLYYKIFAIVNNQLNFVFKRQNTQVFYKKHNFKKHDAVMLGNSKSVKLVFSRSSSAENQFNTITITFNKFLEILKLRNIQAEPKNSMCLQ